MAVAVVAIDSLCDDIASHLSHLAPFEHLPLDLLDQSATSGRVDTLNGEPCLRADVRRTGQGCELILACVHFLLLVA